MTYTISENGIKIIKRNIVFIIIFASSIGLISSCFAIFYTLNDIRLSLITCGIFVLLIILFLFFVVKITLKSVGTNIKSIYYILDNEHLIIKRNNYEQYNVSKEEIKHINKYKNNMLVIILNNNKKININKYLGNYDNFFNELKSLSTVNEINKNPYTLLNIISAVTALVVTGIFLWSGNLLLVIITSVLVFFFCLYLFIHAITNKNIDPKKKKLVYLLIIIVFIIIERIMKLW